jgi:hypothetical protein
LCVIVPLEACASICDTKDVSEGEILIKDILDNACTIVQNIGELPNIARFLYHSASIDNGDISEKKIVVKLRLPIIIEAQRNITSEIVKCKVHDHLVSLGVHDSNSHRV